MKHSELEAMCARYGLGPSQSERFALVLSELASDEHSPTAVRDPRRALGVHIADALSALELDVVRAGMTFADLGSGAGFPGIPLAIALPESAFSLIDSQARKCAFVENLIRRANVDNASAIWSRAEEWKNGMLVNDIVLARALGPPSVVLEYSAPLLKLGGALVDWRGRREPAQEQAAQLAAKELGLELVEIRRTEPFDGARSHHLHLYVKSEPTPDRFPRRAGVALKRPLGTSDRGQR